MFMPGPPEITAEQQVAMRKKAAKGFVSFFGIVAAIRFEPLPARNFMFVCKQTTMKELRNEIKRRILPITTQPIVLLLGGFELMDDDLVLDILSPGDFICVHKAGIDGAPVVAQKPDRSVVISKKVHEGDLSAGAGQKKHKKKRLSAESAYDAAGEDQENVEDSGSSGTPSDA
ncbi:hypothetical protein IW150_003228, partial [Coemansia sp. RSA 2607]